MSDTQTPTQARLPVMAGAAVERLFAFLGSERFRQPVRVGLAMVIAYYISLAMGWDRPQWSGLAVALCSLATVGDSLNKGLLRVLGTLLAGTVALFLISVFPQQRLPYLLAMTIYIAFCTYMMGSTSRWYFWFIAGYVMPLLALAGGPVASTEFETVVLRLQQTTMGVIVFTLVSLLLWPRHTSARLKETVGNLVEVHGRLLAQYLLSLGGMEDDGESARLRAEATVTVAQLSSVVDGAVLDNFEVWETRRLWRLLASDFAALNEALERWRQGFPELQRLDLGRLMPGLPDLGAELDTRLAAIVQMLAGKAPQYWPEEVAWGPDEASLGMLDSFDRAALVRSRDQLQQIEQLTQALFDTTAAIYGFLPAPRHREGHSKAPRPRPLDPDRLSYAIRSFVAVWLVLLACIYVPAFPMPQGIIPVVAAVAIQLSLMPEFPVRLLIVPTCCSVAFAGVFHLFVMPHLGDFVGLGLGIFIATFAICFLLAKPKQSMARSIALSLFVMVIFVSNEQSYNFLYVVNFGLMFELGLFAVWISSFFPTSHQLPHVIVRHLYRYFQSCERLATPAKPDAAQGFRGLRRARLSFHRQEVAILPGRIARSFAALPAAALDAGARDQAQAMATSLQALADRMADLVEARRAPLSEDMVNGLRADVHGWRMGMQGVLRDLAADPASADAALLRARLDAKLAALETRIKDALNAAQGAGAAIHEIDNSYRLLGAYRGVSEALLSVAQQAADIDWNRLRESRF